MAFDPDQGIPLLERHLLRMKTSAIHFGYPFDRHATRNELQAATFRLRDARRIRLVLGLGSGVVADSHVEEEWRECLAKGAFVTAGEAPFDLIETMAFDPLKGMPLLERHLARIKASAQAFGFAFDRHAVRNELQAATFRLREERVVRLLLGPSGALAIEIAPVAVAKDI